MSLFGSGTAGLGSREIFIYLMILSLVGLFLPGRITEPADHFLGRLLGPLNQKSRQTGQALSDRLRSGEEPDRIAPRDWRRVVRQNEEFVIENANLRQELANQRQLVERLTGLRQSLRMERMGLVAASVTGATSDSASQVFQLDQGSNSQVGAGQFVVGCGRWHAGEPDAGRPEPGVVIGPEVNPESYNHAVVGRIASAGRHTSKLQLITDPAFRVPVLIEPATARAEHWQAEGMLIGQGIKPMRVTLVSANYAVQPGDPVFIRSAADTLPLAVLTGWVQGCQRDEKNPVMLSITVRPAFDLNRLGEVVVLTPTTETPLGERP